MPDHARSFVARCRPNPRATGTTRSSPAVHSNAVLRCPPIGPRHSVLQSQTEFSKGGSHWPPYGTSSADGEVEAVLRSEPPVEGGSLNGWVAPAEWAARCGRPGTTRLGRAIPEVDAHADDQNEQ